MILAVIVMGIIVGIALSFCVTSFRLSFSNELGDAGWEPADYSDGPLIVHEYRKDVEDKMPEGGDGRKA